MSYNITIIGHKAFDAPEQAGEFEQGIVDKAREFVQSLEGVTSATLSGGTIGHHDLNVQPSEPAAA